MLFAVLVVGWLVVHALSFRGNSILVICPFLPFYACTVLTSHLYIWTESYNNVTMLCYVLRNWYYLLYSYSLSQLISTGICFIKQPKMQFLYLLDGVLVWPLLGKSQRTHLNTDYLCGMLNRNITVVHIIDNIALLKNSSLIFCIYLYIRSHTLSHISGLYAVLLAY